MAKQKSGGGTVQVISALVQPVLEELGLRLWDVRFEKEGPDWFLKVFIDRDEPLDMKACEDATRAINPVLDEKDPISQAYYLEVGSPGLGRKLTRDEHFETKKGEEVMALLIRPDEDGNREVRGILGDKDAQNVCITKEDKEYILPLNTISYVKLCDDDDLF